MWAGLFHALRWAVTLGAGYLVNDATEWVGNVTGTSRDEKGKYPFWLIMVVLVLLGLVVTLIVYLIKSLFPKKAVS